jgi:hypothetical protein
VGAPGSGGPGWMPRALEVADDLIRRSRQLRAELTATERECGSLKRRSSRRRAAGIRPNPGELAAQLMLAAGLAVQRINPLDQDCSDLAARAVRLGSLAEGAADPARVEELAGQFLEQAVSIRVQLDAIEREHIGLQAQVERLRSLGRLDRPRPAGRLQDTGPLADVDGYGPELCPNPLEAQTAAEFIAMLREYRIWAGEPSLRVMTTRTGTPSSTLGAALNGATLPPMETVTAIITGCRGSLEDQRRFVTAWRRIRFGRAGGQPPAARHRK